MEKTIYTTKSKYIKQSKVNNAVSSISFAFFFALYILPQYFGFPLPFFDLTVLRIMMILMLLFIFGVKQRQQEFMNVVAKAPFSKVLIPYVIILVYTMVLHTDVNALLNPISELLCLFLLIYIIENSFGYKRTLVYILAFSYILASLGLLEFVMQRSPFSYLETISGLSSGRFMRSGYYRIMGPANHSLGYGLMLITMLPIVCFDIEKEEINILRHKLLLVLVVVNVLLTGSRSTLSVLLLEFALLTLFSKRINKKKLIIIGSLSATAFIIILILLRHTEFAHYILLQITSVIDELFGTKYSTGYGADLDALSDSADYRNQLIHIFQVDWLNPLLGMGRNKSFSCEINGSYIKSVDCFYIAEYVRYAYPGMISYIIFLLYFLVRMFKNSIQKKSQISRMLFVGALCYCINILWLDSLQTLKYLYIFFALFYCLPENNPNDREVKEKSIKKLPSKYLKQEVHHEHGKYHCSYL